MSGGKRKLLAVLLSFIVLSGMISPALQDLDPIGTAAANHGGTHVDDFEDGDINIETAGITGWSGATSYLSTTQDFTISGSYSGHFNPSSTGDTIKYTPDTNITPTRLATKLRIINSADTLRYRVADGGGTHIIQINFDSSTGEIQRYNGTGWETVGYWDVDQKYALEITNIDFTNDQYDIVINGNNTGTYGFESSASSISEINFYGISTEALIDDLEHDGSNYGISEGDYSGIVDEFEDGDTTVNHTNLEGWRDQYGGLSTSTSAITGSYSGNLTSDGSKTKREATLQPEYVTDFKPYRITFDARISADTDNSNDQVKFVLSQDDHTPGPHIEFHDGTNEIRVSENTTSDTSTGETWTTGTVYRVNITNIDYSTNTFDLYLDGTNLGTYDFEENMNDFEKFKVHTDTDDSLQTRSVYFDNVRIWKNKSSTVGEARPITETNEINGTVKNQHGSTVANATVELWMINDANTTTDAGETVEEAQKDLVEEISRAVPRDRYDPNVDPLNADKFTGENAGKQVLIHKPGAYTSEANVIGDFSVSMTGDLERPVRQLEPDTTYAFSIVDRTKEPRIEDGVDDQIDPGVTTSGNVTIRQIGPGNSTVDEISKETKEQVYTGPSWAKIKKHEYAEIELPVGYYEVVPESGGVPMVIQVGNPEEIPRTIEKDLKDVNNNKAEIAKEITSEIDAGNMTRATVETNATGYFNYSVPSGYSTVAITVFDGGGLTDGITDPTMEDLRTQVQQQDYNGSILLSSSPKTVHPPASGIEITVVEIKRPTLSDIQAYLDNLAWVEDLVNKEDFLDVASLWTEPTVDVGKDELEDRSEEIQRLIEQNQDLEERLEEQVEQNENLKKSVDQLREELRNGTISRSDLEELTSEQSKVVNEIQPEITVEAPDPPEYDVPETDGEPTLLDLELPISSRGTQSTELTRDGVAVMVHFDSGTSTNMSDQYWSIDNNPGASSGTGSSVVVSDYPIPADVAVASIELLVANEDGAGRDQVQVENPAIEGTAPELDSINVDTMRPGPSETISISVSPSETSTYDSISSATVTAPDGSKLPTTITGDEVEFTTSGSGTHVVQLDISDGSRTYTEPLRLKAGEEPIDYPASVRVHNGILGKKVIASDGVDSAEADLERGGAAARITAKVDRSDPPGEIHVHTRELTGRQQDVSIAVIDADDGSRISASPVVKIHMSRLSDGALVRKDGKPITEDANRHGKVEDQSTSTLITAIARDGTADVSVNNDPGLPERIDFTIDKTLDAYGVPTLVVAPVVELEPAAVGVVERVAEIGAVSTELLDPFEAGLSPGGVSV